MKDNFLYRKFKKNIFMFNLLDWIRKYVLIILSDKMFLKIMYRIKMHRKLNLNNPKTYNEKLQWLKIYDRNPLYTDLADKYKVRDYIKNVVGEQYLIPLLGVYDSFSEIDFKKLPNQFVIKCNHDSASVIICKNKKTFDIEAARKKITKALKTNYYYVGREWVYKNIKPKIIIEKYMVDESQSELKDYKFFCFNGEAKMLFVAKDRPHATKFNYYDINLNKLDIKQYYPNFDGDFEKPINYDKMVEIANKISKKFNHVRVDLYNVKGKIYFGEITFYHFGGFFPFEPETWDYKMGEMLNLKGYIRKEKNK